MWGNAKLPLPYVMFADLDFRLDNEDVDFQGFHL